jgi:hypothetical protein
MAALSMLTTPLLLLMAETQQQQQQHQQHCGSGSGAAGQRLLFGDHHIAIELDSETLGVLNVSVCADDGRVQGFVAADDGSGTATAASLWQLNTTNCSSTIPAGTRVDGGSPASERTRMLLNTTATTKVLVLRWAGVQLASPTGTTADVELNVTLTASMPGRLSLSAAVTSGSGVCVQALALPNLPRMHLRGPSTDAMFLPMFFGHLGDAWGTPAGPHCGDPTGQNCAQGTLSLN